MNDIPEHIVRQVRRLAERGEPVAEIAFMTRLTEAAIRDILAQAVTTTKEKAPAKAGVGEATPEA